MNIHGMTKIEILIVALIIGLLGVSAVLAISNARSQARDAVRLSDIRQIQTGLELAFNDFSSYPESLTPSALGTPSANCLRQDGFAASCNRTTDTIYVEVIAPPPTAGLNGLVSCGGENNVYCFTGFQGAYRIQFELEKAQPLLNLVKGVNCATESGFEAGTCRAIANAPVVVE